MKKTPIITKVNIPHLRPRPKKKTIKVEKIKLNITPHKRDKDEVIRETLKKIKTTLRELENELDTLNSIYESKDELCIICKAKDYDGKEGIRHKEWCIIKKIRRSMRE